MELGCKELQVFIVERAFGGDYIRTTSYNIPIVGMVNNGVTRP